MKDPTSRRKSQHLAVIRTDPDTDRRGLHFDSIRLTHRALPELDWQDVDPSITFLGRKLSFPFLISSMTGGDAPRIRTINRNLAAAAQACGVAMAVGSQRVMFTHPRARASFDLRPRAPDVPLIANLGAVQLNHGFGLPECRAAVGVLAADGLYFHLNPLQEAVQHEGDVQFGLLAEKIGAVARQLGVPVLVKEVGAGLALADARRLVRQGIRHLDVAGAGGTSWSRVEHGRQANRHDTRGLLFQDWGIPTPEALRQLAPLRPRVTLIASGGLRSGLDMAKAIVLGASLCGMAAPLLSPALESAEAVIRVIESLRQEFMTAMFLLGMRSVAEMRGKAALLQSGAAAINS